MDKELLNVLNEWIQSDENFYNAMRSVKYGPSTYALGEFVIMIKSILKVNDQTISLNRNYYTFAQSDSPFIKNKKGDVYNLKIFIKKFDEDFVNEIQNSLGSSFKESDETGFISL